MSDGLLMTTTVLVWCWETSLGKEPNESLRRKLYLRVSIFIFENSSSLRNFLLLMISLQFQLLFHFETGNLFWLRHCLLWKENLWRSWKYQKPPVVSAWSFHLSYNFMRSQAWCQYSEQSKQFSQGSTEEIVRVGILFFLLNRIMKK